MSHTRRRRSAALIASLLGAAVLAATAASKTTSPNGTYKGKTSNGLGVSFQIKDGKVRKFDATVHAFCISAATASTRLDAVLHHITPQAMRLSGGKFKGEYRVRTGSTHAKVDGRVSGKSATGHYSISYTMMYGTTSTGLINIWACQEKGTWKATRR